ncbi:hypothetical protein LX36DRAFT_13737 [Colletotrichum falcatum]|nr:hypothetical protein LX36DRAFT_13737 [Colletotrichum falcatum]
MMDALHHRRAQNGHRDGNFDLLAARTSKSERYSRSSVARHGHPSSKPTDFRAARAGMARSTKQRRSDPQNISPSIMSIRLRRCARVAPFFPMLHCIRTMVYPIRTYFHAEMAGPLAIVFPPETRIA